MIYLRALKSWREASVIQRMTKKWKYKEEAKNKTSWLRRNGPGDSLWRQSGEEKWDYGGRICERGKF